MRQHAVRPATKTDAATVRSVIQRAIRGSTGELYTTKQIDAWARGGSTEDVAAMITTATAFVAEVDGKVVGFSNLDGREVDQLYVDPAFGGMGVGRRLYEAVEDEARRRGIQQLTATASLRAVPAFRSFGFSEDSRTERSFNGETFAVVEMKKDLAASA